MQTSSELITARLRRLGEHHDRAHERARAASTAHKAPERPESAAGAEVAPEAAHRGA